ncbi:MAG: hypothetical protein IH624_14850 [Phycisphaerae bacterium]|nr:hypothetical protein [Phycisphaerae bacterium]
MTKFGSDGRLLIPFRERTSAADPQDEKARYVIEHAYCPNGCSVMDIKHKIGGYPGLKIRFRRPGMDGIFVISAIEGDFNKVILEGELADGVKDELYCPHCDAMFRKLVTCNCKPDGDLIVIGLTPELDFNNAVTFCNVTGCHNGAFVQSGHILRHVRLLGH